MAAQQQMQSADVYTDINSLQKLKTSDDKDLALRQVAQQFESLFLGLMLKSMRDANAVFEEDSLFNSGESKFYRDMYDQQLSLSMAHSKQGGVGIADALYRQMSASYGDKLTNADGGLSIGPALSTTNSSSKTKYTALADSPEEFVKKVSPIMLQGSEKLGVDADILVAQAALETGWGKSVLSQGDGSSSYNLFNIKAGSQWQGKTVEVSTLEFAQGTFKPEHAKFRAYDSLEESVNDYVRFVQENPRYQQALKSASDSTDYIRELHKAGYATDPDYADKVLSVKARVVSGFSPSQTSET